MALKDIELDHNDEGLQLIKINYPDLVRIQRNPIPARLKMGNRYCPNCRYMFLARKHPYDDWRCEACDYYPENLGANTTVLAVFVHDPAAKEP